MPACESDREGREQSLPHHINATQWHKEGWRALGDGFFKFGLKY